MAEENVPEYLELKKVWTGFENQPFLHATDVWVHHIADEFYLTIGQVQFPLFTPATDPTEIEAIRERGTVPVQCLMRFALSHETMRQFVEALKGNLQRWEERGSL